MLHMLLDTSKYENITSPYWFNSKRYYIRLDHFILGQIRNTSIQIPILVGSVLSLRNQKQVDSIHKFESNHLPFPYSHTITHSPTLVIYCSTQLHKFIITYLYFICKYSYANKYWVVLDYLIQDSQFEITLRESWLIFPL